MSRDIDAQKKTSGSTEIPVFYLAFFIGLKYALEAHDCGALINEWDLYKPAV